MIEETRYLTFTNRAVMAAIHHYHATVAGDPLPGAPVKFWIKSACPLVAVAHIQSACGRIREIHFTRDQLTALLTHLCRKQRIRLPREADKMLITDGHELCLAVRNTVPSAVPA